MEDDSSLEDLIRELARRRTAPENACSPASTGWLNTQDAAESTAGTGFNRYGATPEEAIARLEAAEGAERLWTQCAEVAEARANGANRRIEALQEALLFYHAANPRSLTWDHVISLLLDGLERALGHLANDLRKQDGLLTSDAKGRRATPIELDQGSDLPLRTDELRSWSLAA